jgi:hypothetical protein
MADTPLVHFPAGVDGGNTMQVESGGVVRIISGGIIAAGTATAVQRRRCRMRTSPRWPWP